MLNERIIITSGKKYIDIDAYAGIFAYKKLLNILGHNAFAYTSATLNESVSPIIKELNFTFDKISILPKDNFIILDVSNPEMFDEKITESNIIEVIDHHTGFEDYWKNKNKKNTIEFIGSICTIIFEKYKSNKIENLLDKNTCKLLIAGILDNTLNLKARLTTTRDIKAYKELLKIGNVSNTWFKDYFNSCYEHIETDIETAIKNDIKIECVSSLLPTTFGQIIVLDKSFISRNINEIKKIFSIYDEWLINIICLEDGKSYLFSNVPKKLEKLFNAQAKNNILVLNKFMLRKEIMKLARKR